MGNNLEMKLNIVIDWGVDLCEIITIVLHHNGTNISETQITITKLCLSSYSGIYIIQTLIWFTDLGSWLFFYLVSEGHSK